MVHGARPIGSIVGLCTLQKGSVAGKVLNDVEKICRADQPPERIYAFLGADMPVAQRHRLIEKAKVKYHVELEVLDANAIAEQLCDFDTYWIAVRYLSLPEQFAPPRPATDGPEQPEWYIDLLSYWRKPDSEPQSLADLIAIREGLRRATFDPDSRADLPFWLDLVRPLADQNADRDLLQRARYEMVVASIRGLGDLRAVDTLADAFLGASVRTTDPSRLEDASIVLSYAGTAASIGHSDLDLGILGDHRRALRSRVAELLADDPPPVRKTRLLQVAGHLSLSPDSARLSRDTEDRAPSQVAMLDQPREPIAPPEAVGMSDIVDVDDALRYWTELATLIPDTPLFPVEDFAEIVQYLTPVLIDADGWEDLVTSLDEAIGRVAGAARVGEGCRDRGVALRAAGRPLDALHEIHRAKLEWWTGDTLRGALLAMTLIAQLYRDLKLPLAAKQYALAVAGAAQSVGDDEVADLVPTGMLLASEISYQAGDWLAALEELDRGDRDARTWTGGIPDSQRVGTAGDVHCRHVPSRGADDRPRLQQSAPHAIHVGYARHHRAHAADVLHLRDVPALAVELANERVLALEALRDLYPPIDLRLGLRDVVAQVRSHHRQRSRVQASPPLKRLTGRLYGSLIGCAKRALRAFDVYPSAQLQEEHPGTVNLPLGEPRSRHIPRSLLHRATLSAASGKVDVNAAVNTCACSDAGRACR